MTSLIHGPVGVISTFRALLYSVTSSVPGSCPQPRHNRRAFHHGYAPTLVFSVQDWDHAASTFKPRCATGNLMCYWRLG
jgi:hypothetical protein